MQRASGIDRRHLMVAAAAGLTILSATAIGIWAQAQGTDERVARAESERIAVIDKVKSSVVAIFSPGGQGGGSGVLISTHAIIPVTFSMPSHSAISIQDAGPIRRSLSRATHVSGNT